jgi:HTH-type transcriptional regulator / antitoxin HipB
MSPSPPSQPLVTALQLGQLLKTARKQSKLTQADVAGRLGLSQNRVSYLEQHPDELSFKQLLGWCAAVGLELRLGLRESTDSGNKAQW